MLLIIVFYCPWLSPLVWAILELIPLVPPGGN